MKVIDQAKAGFADAKKRVLDNASAIFRSRAALALSWTFAIGFTCQVLFARDRLAPVGVLSPAQVGLPPLDFGQTVNDAGQAAVRQGAPATLNAWFTQFFNEHAVLIPYLNITCMTLSILFAIWTLWLQTQNFQRNR